MSTDDGLALSLCLKLVDIFPDLMTFFLTIGKETVNLGNTAGRLVLIRVWDISKRLRSVEGNNLDGGQWGNSVSYQKRLIP